MISKNAVILERIKAVDRAVHFRDIDETYYREMTVGEGERRFGMKFDQRRRYLVIDDKVYFRGSGGVGSSRRGNSFSKMTVRSGCLNNA